MDLSGIDENERQQLKQTLFSEGTDFLQLPWPNEVISEEWQKETYGESICMLILYFCGKATFIHIISFKYF